MHTLALWLVTLIAAVFLRKKAVHLHTHLPLVGYVSIAVRYHGPLTPHETP